MKADDSPFKRLKIKELPYESKGTFEWLEKYPLCQEWAIGERQDTELKSQLKSLRASAKKLKVQVPEEFSDFIRSPSLHNRIRSVTACYLDVSTALFPYRSGYLARFLNDQQGCAFWYLYLNEDGSDHCVVASEVYYDVDNEYEKEDLRTSCFYFWAESFEAAMCRFWLENEIEFAEIDGTPLPDVDPKYLKLHKQ